MLRKYGDPEDVKKLDLMQPNINDPQMSCVYQGALIGALARLFEQQVWPRPRGRPRKAGKAAYARQPISGRCHTSRRTHPF